MRWFTRRQDGAERKTSAVVIDEQGPAENMRLEERAVGAPGPGEALIEQTAIGLNYLEIYQRSGLYPIPTPAVLGTEAAGRVLAVGEGVTVVSEGDRVAYAGVVGAYAGLRLIAADRLVKLPETVTDETAAATLLKGMTVEYLLERTRPLGTGDWALFYAASGGVGRLAGPWGKALGARMIGVTSGPENCAAALANGYEAAIDRKSEDIAARVAEITGGAGVVAAYDSAGAATFETTLKALAPRGSFVSFGSTTGPIPPINPLVLQQHGSLIFTRPSLMDYVKTRAELEHSAGRLFTMLESGAVTASIGARRPLSEIVEAHKALESGATTGSTVLTP